MYRGLFYSIWKNKNTRDIVIAVKGKLGGINLKLNRNLRLIRGNSFPNGGKLEACLYSFLSHSKADYRNAFSYVVQTNENWLSSAGN